jgi:hypothetical protein
MKIELSPFNRDLFLMSPGGAPSQKEGLAIINNLNQGGKEHQGTDGSRCQAEGYGYPRGQETGPVCWFQEA